MTPIRAIYVLWGVWLLSWLLAAAWSAPTEKRVEKPSIERAVRLLIGVGAALLLLRLAPRRLLAEPLWRLDTAAESLLATATAAGFLFTWWARIHLGRLWSGSVVKKAGHHVVDTGPYGLVRHPIYTGLIAAALATAAAKGTVAAVLGVFIVTLGFVVKARIEERFLRAELGADAYDSYAHRVPMLVPWT